MGKIRIGIVGYGNIGRGVEQSIKRNDDMELKAVFTRRDPASVKIQTEGAEVKHFDDMEAMKDDIDVMILCGGSATDLPVIGPKVAASFNTIDSFDTHAKIPEYFANVDKAAKEGKNVSIISVGWDPGMFSLNRLYAESILVQGSTYTFWGKGVSQGHSDAIRRIEGVKNGIQYTVPIEAAVDQVRSGSEPELTTRQKHLRECYVVAEEGADKAAIEEAIKTMPNYFDEYDTTVTFITEEELKENHSKMPHGGFESGIYRKCSGCLCTCCISSVQKGRIRSEKRIRYRTGYAVSDDTGRVKSTYVVRDKIPMGTGKMVFFLSLLALRRA